jgi:alkanesulfonate monooxygenase SsuD/methylene tetrahydromethanopterin reductase-like flavin-dependent oxidoreductase (luciferase family)
MDLAAHYADMQFSTRRTMASMKEHRTRLDQKLASFGRRPEDCGILWSVRVQVAESEEAARAMEEHYLDSIPPEAGLIELSSMYGLDFSKFRRDRKLSDVAAEVKAQNVHWGSFEEILKTTDPSLTVEQFGRRFMTERVLVAAGTPKMIVDKLEQWHFETGANGGFMLARGFSAPGNLQEFVDHVVPELQRRGLSKKKYVGTTLRDNFNN